MFGQVLFTQFRWTRLVVAIMSVFCFIVPSAAWWVGGERVLYPTRPAAVIAGFQSVGPMLVLVGLLGAFLMAAYPWTMDAASKHVFALSLPIPWRKYVTLRYWSGALLLVPPAVALWLGSLFVLALLELPPTLRAYPGTLALRYLAASLVAYSVIFAVQYIAGKRSAAVVLGCVVGVAFLSVVLNLTGNGEFVATLTRWLTDFPGPFAAYTAPWKLIDV